MFLVQHLEPLLGYQYKDFDSEEDAKKYAKTLTGPLVAVFEMEITE